LKQFKIEIFDEPALRFAYNQSLDDPRDGLTIFGPYDKGSTSDFSVGIIGTEEGIRRCKNWLLKLNKPIYHTRRDIARPFFPGFEEVFQVAINLNALPEVVIDEKILKLFYRYDDNHVRVSEIVDLYVEKLKEYQDQNERRPSLWFVIIPDIIYTLCRPKSFIPKEGSIHVGIPDEYTRYQKGFLEPEEYDKWRSAYYYENNFHNQLKIKLLKFKILTQIIKEGTIAFHEYPALFERKRESETAISWNLATTIYYKIGGIPWKLENVRPGVCYLGLSFKKDDTNQNPTFACCAAQMFLDSGNGVVFRGRVGPYYNTETKEYHLTKESAFKLLSQALESFKKENLDSQPKEIFIHGRTFFNDEEWKGFTEAVNDDIKLVGVRIRNENIFKLFRNGDYPILRGSAFIKNERTAYLWTKGFIPRIQSVLGLETPNPLSIQIVKGEAQIDSVCKDILALTKLNYNSCIYCDGQPVTLKFSNLIGEILTAGPNENLEILPFMYYI
jgi:hypothetical protein